MLETLLQIFKKPKLVTHQERDKRRYAFEVQQAQSQNISQRMSLACNTKTHQEILYYLAQKDPDPKVRRAVAENVATPLHASTILASDADTDVRMALAGRLVDLLPDLSHDKHSQLYAFVVQGLATLALDEVLKIRKALSSTLKDHAHTPPKIAGQLARDIEREVAEPILRFCAALTDDDLVDILKEHPSSWAVEAIARRPGVSEPVSQAVIDTGNIPAGALLLQNQDAQISKALLEFIVERARQLPEWHAPIAMRRNLPPEMAKVLAEYVDDSVRKILLKRGDFNEKMSDEIATVVRRRLDFADALEQAGETASMRVAQLAAEGKLNEEAISDALAMRDKDFVIAALAHLIGVKAEDIGKVFDMKAPKAIIAVSWKAGLSMRLGLALQKDLGHVQPKELLYPRNGSDYPLSEEDLKWQLDFLGIKGA